MNPSSSRARLALPAAVLLAVGCSGSSDGDKAFVVRTPEYASDADKTPEVDAGWIVFLADETTSGGPSTASPDLNADGDTNDDVAVAARLGNAVTTPLRAARETAIVDGQIYMVVDEAEDGMNWDGDVADNLVLLHWSQAADVVTFVDGIDPASIPGRSLNVQEDRRLYYASSAAPAGDATSLQYIDKADPTTPIAVQNQVGGGALAPVLLGDDQGLLFLGLDETTGPGVSPDYNLDGDSLDTTVLALLDGSDADAQVLLAGVALADENAPFSALRNGLLSEWTFAVLVNELAQGGVNLNDPANFPNPLMPDSCAATPDADTDDDVLFYGRYEDLVLATPAVNTGLAGRDRALVVEDFVATLMDELDVGCDMNEDGDTEDSIPRWVETVDPLLPPRDPSQLRAAFDVPGGSFGLVALGEEFVMVVDETADSVDVNADGDEQDTLVGILDPSDGFAVTWDFDHPDGNPGTGLPGENFVGASWMAESSQSGRLGLAFQESVPGQSLNIDLFCDLVTKDADTTDALPVWGDLEGSAPILDFDGQGYALLETDPGIVIAKGWVFYRVSESADNFDYNQDGDENDVILFRNPETTCSTTAMATASALPGTTPVVHTDGFTGCAFLSSEFQAGVDLNSDGDTNDLVTRWFVF